jgi:tryptophanyl-tRNA synthetase
MISEKAYLQEVYTNGAQKASAIARKTLRKVYKKVGFVEKPF